MRTSEQKRAIVKQAIKRIMTEESGKNWPDFKEIATRRILGIPGLLIEDDDQTPPERLERVTYGTADTCQSSTSRMVYCLASAEDWKAAGFVKCIPQS